MVWYWFDYPVHWWTMIMYHCMKCSWNNKFYSSLKIRYVYWNPSILYHCHWGIHWHYNCPSVICLSISFSTTSLHATGAIIGTIIAPVYSSVLLHWHWGNHWHYNCPSIFFRIALLALGQSCPSASKAIRKNMDKQITWLPARWAPGFSGDHQQDLQCLWFPSYYNVTHVICPSLFVFCWE